MPGRLDVRADACHVKTLERATDGGRVALHVDRKVRGRRHSGWGNLEAEDKTPRIIVKIDCCQTPSPLPFFAGTSQLERIALISASLSASKSWLVVRDSVGH